jgi:DNA-binding transcriptional regulator YiaG
MNPTRFPAWRRVAELTSRAAPAARNPHTTHSTALLPGWLDSIEDFFTEASRSGTLALHATFGLTAVLALVMLANHTRPAIVSRAQSLRDDLTELLEMTHYLQVSAAGEPEGPFESFSRNLVRIVTQALDDPQRVNAYEVNELLADSERICVMRRQTWGRDLYATQRARLTDVLTRLAGELVDTPAGPLSLGALIRERRKAAHLTQAALAAKLMVDPMTVSRWERDHEEPTPPTRRLLADILGGRPNDYTR